MSITAKSEESPRASAEGRRHYLTLLFADLTGSTTLGEQMEAEDYAEIVGRLRDLCREIIPRHGGSIARMQGDGVLAIFGYPEPNEDDSRRATQAALELHAAVTALPMRGPGGAPLTMHSGIHAGLVLLRPGDVELGRFELLGDTPNTAARLSSLAGADEVVMSEETLGRQERYFLTSEASNVQLKGRAAALRIVRILGAANTAGGSTAARRDLAPLVGRREALRRLCAHAHDVRGSRPHSVALCGAPGMGKTRLLEEFLRDPSAARFRVLRGYCEDTLSAEPLQPFAQIARALAPAGSASALAPLCNRVLQGEFGAVSEVLASLPADQPLMLVLDDWHWADEASQLALDAVMRLARPIGVVLASRQPAEGLPDGTQLIELPPFDEGEATQAVRHLLPRVDPFTIAEINRYAGGIPLFIEELCHSAAARGAPALSNLRGSGRAWINVLTESRVERLPPQQAKLVRAASVLGSAFPGWLLERITGQAPDSPDMLQLAARDFIYAGEQSGMLRFKHGITRDAIYETVGLRERGAMHRQIALTLQAQVESGTQEDLQEALAYHCALGGMPEEAARYAEGAGDKANAASALDRARAQYAAALRALDQAVPLDREAKLRWCAIAEKLGWACVFDPLALADGLATFERSVQLARECEEPRALARALYWLGYLSYAKGLGQRSIVQCEAALELATQVGDARLAAQVRGTLGQALLSACRYQPALLQLDAALQAGTRSSAARGRVAAGRAYTLACKGYLLGDRGDFAAADECFDEARQLLGDAQHQVAASVRHWMSVVWQWQGRWQEALQAADEAASIAMHVRSRQQLAMGRALAGHARWMLARDPAGLQAVREATAWIEAQKGALATSLNHAWMVEGALAEGREAEACRHAALLLWRARRDDRIGEALGCRALARAASAGGQFARAARWLRLAQRSAAIRESRHEHAANLLCEAQLALEQGRGEEAERLLVRCAAEFRALRMDWHLRLADQLAASMEASPELPAADPPRQ